MEPTQRDEIFGIICQMSDRQVDPKVKKRLQAMMGRPNAEIKDLLLGLIDDISFASLTGDFELRVLDGVWRRIGGSESELQDRNQMLENAPDKLMRDRFGWEFAGRLEERR